MHWAQIEANPRKIPEHMNPEKLEMSLKPNNITSA